MKDEEQERTPFLDAYVEYVKSDPVCFDVPGHKRGHFITDLSRKISPIILQYDVNAPYGLDNLYNAKSLILESEKLASRAFHADKCFFSINGTTGGILTMFLACLKSHDKVILPRNIHKSVINALIISGAVPIFIDPVIDEDLGIANGVSTDSLKKKIDENPDAKAVFIINPTYYGITSNLKEIVKIAHEKNMIVMVDEAHGSNFVFSDKLPICAMDCDADISSMSIHKNSGSLTQSSFILAKGNRVDEIQLKKSFAMLSSTSPNSLLLCSLDAARKEMYLRGKEVIDDNLEIARYIREEINKIDGLKTIDSSYLDKFDDDGVYDIDLTKIVIDVRGLNMYGYDVYKLLRLKYNIQVELGEVSLILVLVGPGSTKDDAVKLVSALKDISMNNKSKDLLEIPKYKYSYPKTLVKPTIAFDAPYKLVPLEDSIGEIATETVMAYPPGIPILIPGEIISSDSIKMIKFYYDEGGEVLKDSDEKHIKVIDLEKWKLSDDFDSKIDI